MTEHHEDNCPHCQECSGCEGSCLPEDMANPVFVRGSGASIGIVCGDCDGEGIICSCLCHVGL